MRNARLQELLNLILYTNEITAETDNAHLEICEEFDNLHSKILDLETANADLHIESIKADEITKQIQHLDSTMQTTAKAIEENLGHPHTPVMQMMLEDDKQQRARLVDELQEIKGNKK
ncbi:MAG: hypothetical protein JKY28_05270 [Sulfurimonas sp.]|nr:hypothetical protein [Sulfurimonas sp.]PHQ88498.1 MAG: hypothetical protein COB42_08735 [Sulfurimonas sp.]PHQ89534.1 MAG: hypothetical protein COB42_06835 [Sulfurimonas sp.]